MSPSHSRAHSAKSNLSSLFKTKTNISTHGIDARKAVETSDKSIKSSFCTLMRRLVPQEAAPFCILLIFTYVAGALKLSFFWVLLGISIVSFHVKHCRNLYQRISDAKNVTIPNNTRSDCTINDENKSDSFHVELNAESARLNNFDDFTSFENVRTFQTALTLCWPMMHKTFAQTLMDTMVHCNKMTSSNSLTLNQAAYDAAQVNTNLGKGTADVCDDVRVVNVSDVTLGVDSPIVHGVRVYPSPKDRVLIDASITFNSIASYAKIQVESDIIATRFGLKSGVMDLRLSNICCKAIVRLEITGRHDRRSCRRAPGGSSKIDSIKDIRMFSFSLSQLPDISFDAHSLGINWMGIPYASSILRDAVQSLFQPLVYSHRSFQSLPHSLLVLSFASLSSDNKDKEEKKDPCVGCLRVTLVNASDVPYPPATRHLPSPYFVLSIGEESLYSTKGTLIGKSPSINQTFLFDITGSMLSQLSCSHFTQSDDKIEINEDHVKQGCTSDDYMKTDKKSSRLYIAVLDRFLRGTKKLLAETEVSLQLLCEARGNDAKKARKTQSLNTVSNQPTFKQTIVLPLGFQGGVIYLDTEFIEIESLIKRRNQQHVHRVTNRKDYASKLPPEAFIERSESLTSTMIPSFQKMIKKYCEPNVVLKVNSVSGLKSLLNESLHSIEYSHIPSIFVAIAIRGASTANVQRTSVVLQSYEPSWQNCQFQLRIENDILLCRVYDEQQGVGSICIGTCDIEFNEQLKRCLHYASADSPVHLEKSLNGTRGGKLSIDIHYGTLNDSVLLPSTKNDQTIQKEHFRM